MTGPRHLKPTLILVALVLALTAVGEARADVTSPAGSNAAPVATGPAPVPTPPAPVSTGPAAVPTPGSTSPEPVPTDPVTVSTPGPTGPAPGSGSDPRPADEAPSPPPADQAPSPPAGDDPPSTAGGPSTDTSQTIVQVQVSGCVTHCQGTSQTQAAQQQNVTVQGAPPAPSPGPSTNQTKPGPPPQGSASVTQIQVGCVHDCSGTSRDTTASPISPAALSQLLTVLGSQTPPGQPPVAPGDQSSVRQTSLQTQQGDASGDDQSQTASQWSTTVQDLVSQAVDATAQAVNETTQAIVQVQIGCLFYCTDTHQTQQASQTNTAVQVVAQGVTAATAPVATGVATVNQLVWQIQIGCLAWCSDTTQEQSAQQSNEVVVTTMPQDPPPAPPPADPGSATGPGDSEPAPGPTDPGPLPAIPGVVPSNPSPSVAAAAPPAPAATAPSDGGAAQWVPQMRVGERRPTSGAPTLPALTTHPAFATTIVPVASFAASPGRTVRAAPIAGLISSGSWQVEGVRAAPATISSPAPARAGGESTAAAAVLATVVALVLGLLGLTAARLRTP